MRAKALWRIRILAAIFGLLFLLLGVRMYQLQVLKHEAYIEAGEAQYVYTVRDLFNRGSIFFNTKNNEQVSAATIAAGYTLVIDPTRIENPAAVYDLLEPHVSFSREVFVDAALRDVRYVELDNAISNETADAIVDLNIFGVALYRNQWRYYPGTTLGAQTVGFVAYGNDGVDIQGQYGLERYYEHILDRNSEKQSVNFFAELFTKLESRSVEKNTEPGHIITTLEPTVMRTLETILQDIQATYDSTQTGGIIIDPQTGRIVAMSSVPSFDLNDRASTTIEDFKNPLVQDVFEFGSIIKALTMAAGIDSGAVNRYSEYYDTGTREYGDDVIGNFDGIGRGTVPMQEVLSQSLNTGVAHIVSEMGNATFRKYFTDLRLGSETGIDLPSEARGLISNLQSPRDIEYATASFGQGIAMTPIATVRALSTLANGGVLVTPHLVDEIQFIDGTSKEIGFPMGDRVFSERSTKIVSQMLTEVVDSALLHGQVRRDDYRIAAKTGTAQIADQEGGGYYEDRFLHSFFGYFPAQDPEYLIFLYTVDPQGGVVYASETLTHPFMEMTDFLINYYEIPPDR